MKLSQWGRQFVALLGSKKFFYITLGLFVFQALWLALSAKYPMAFDENFHFGFIQVYATQWSPFISEAPEGTGALGALTREPSYLFAYLMSFPYRAIAWLSPHVDVHIIFLRFINIAFFTGGIILFRQLLFKTGASRALTQFSLFIFTFIPAVPFLAAHINYDNLLFLLVPIILLVGLKCGEAFKEGVFPLHTLILLAGLCGITSVIKYPFLPIAAGIAIYLALCLGWKRSNRRVFGVFKTIPEQWGKVSFIAKIGVVILIIIGGGLFIERYGGNYVNYGSLVPDCLKVLDFKHCAEYGPWIRNYYLEQNAPDYVAPNLPFFTLNWFYDMLFRLFFAINSEYVTRVPLVLPFVTALMVAVTGLIFVGRYAKQLYKKYPTLLLFGIVIIVYTATLFVRGFGDYLDTGQFLAFNGRYFIPILPLILILIGLAFREHFVRKKIAEKWKIGIAAIALVFFLQGGGLFTYILRSDASWHRPDPVVVSINESTRQLLSPLILGEWIPLPFSN